MIAFAQEAVAPAGAEAVHAEPFYTTAEFWVAVALLIFVFLIGRRVFRLVVVALDDRAEKTKNRIEEANRMVEEAQTLLATYERKQRDAAEEADSILTSARRETARFTAEAKADLERALKRREAQALDRIAQAEQAALAEVRSRAVDVAIEATRRLLVERLTPQQADALVDSAIQELPKKLH
jgi:F-type H+-transporting ATPase subunit b